MPMTHYNVIITSDQKNAFWHPLFPEGEIRGKSRRMLPGIPEALPGRKVFLNQ